MIGLLTKDGLKYFSVHGAEKYSGKNFAATQLLAEGVYSVAEANSGSLTLSESQAEYSPDGKDQLSRLAVFSFLAEITSRSLEGEEAGEVYPWLKESLAALRSGFDPYTTALMYFAHLLVFLGYGLEVGECVRCGKKSGIVGFSYADGGFVCGECLLSEAERRSARELKIYRYIFKAGLSDFERVSFTKIECLHIIDELGVYYHDQSGVELKSLSLLLKS